MDLQQPSSFKFNTRAFAAVGEGVGRQELFIAQWLSALEEDVKSAPLDILEGVRGSLERELLRIVCETRPRPTRLIRQGLGRCYEQLFARGASGSGPLIEVLNALTSLLASGKGIGSEETRMAAVHALGALLARFGQQLHHRCDESIHAMVKVTKQFPEDTPLRLEVFEGIGRILTGAGRGLSEGGGKDLVKFLRGCIKPHKKLVAAVQGAAAVCLEQVLVLTRYGHPFRRSATTPLIVELVKVLEAPPVTGDTVGESSVAGRRVAGALAALLSRAHLPFAGEGVGGGEGASQTRTEDKDLRALSLEETLRHLSGPLRRLSIHPESGGGAAALAAATGGRGERSRALLLGVYGELCGRLGPTWTARHYAQLLRHLLLDILTPIDLPDAPPSPTTEIDGPGGEGESAEVGGVGDRVEAALARLLRRIAHRWLPEGPGREGALQELVRSWIRAWPAVLAGERAPGPRVLRIVLAEAAALLRSGVRLPSSGGEGGMVEAVERLLLHHPRWSVQAVAAQTLRQMVRASPGLLPPLVQRLHRHLQGQLSLGEGGEGGVRIRVRVRGSAAGLAVLVAEAPAHPLVVGEGGDAWVFALVTQLLRVQGPSPLGYREAGWLLVSALAKAGPRRLGVHLTPLLLQCKAALPRPSKRRAGTKGGPHTQALPVDAAAADLHDRVLALAALLEVLRGAGDLVSLEVGRRILSLLHNAWAALAEAGTTVHPRLRSQAKALLLRAYAALAAQAGRGLSASILRLAERGGTQPWVQTVVRASLDAIVHAEGLSAPDAGDPPDPSPAAKSKANGGEGGVGSLEDAALSGMASALWGSFEDHGDDDNSLSERETEGEEEILGEGEGWKPILPRSVTFSPGWIGVLSPRLSLTPAHQAVDGAIDLLGALLPLLADVKATSDTGTTSGTDMINSVLQQIETALGSSRLSPHSPARLALQGSALALVGRLAESGVRGPWVGRAFSLLGLLPPPPPPTPAAANVSAPTPTPALLEADPAGLWGYGATRERVGEVIGLLAPLSPLPIMTAVLQGGVDRLVRVRDPWDRMGIALVVGHGCGGVGASAVGAGSVRAVVGVLEALGRDPHRGVSISASRALTQLIVGAGTDTAAWTPALLSAVIHGLSHALPGLEEDRLGGGVAGASGQLLEGLSEILGPELASGGHLLATCTTLADALWRSGTRGSVDADPSAISRTRCVGLATTSVRCWGHYAAFAPAYVRPALLIPRLQALLLVVRPDPGEGPESGRARDAALACMSQLVQRDVEGVWEGGGRADLALQLLLLAEPSWPRGGMGGKHVVGTAGDILHRLLHATALSDTAPWVRLSVDVILGRTGGSGGGGMAKAEVDPSTALDDLGGDGALTGGAESRGEAAGGGLGAPAVRWEAQWMGLRCLLWLVEDAALRGDARHMDALLAPRSSAYLVHHVGDLIRTSLGAATSPMARVRLEGLILLQAVLAHFGCAIDPEGLDEEEEEEGDEGEDADESKEDKTARLLQRMRNGTPLLAQFQAQITAAITPALTLGKEEGEAETGKPLAGGMTGAAVVSGARSGDEVEVVALAVRVAAQYIGAGIVREVGQMGRVLRLLHRSLQAISQAEGQEVEEEETAADLADSVVAHVASQSAPAALMVKVAVLQGWARLTNLYWGLTEEVEDATHPPEEGQYAYLQGVLEPRLHTLAPLWMRALEEYGRFRVGAEGDAVGSGGDSGASKSGGGGGVWTGVSPGVGREWGRAVYEGGGGAWVEILAAASTLPPPRSSEEEEEEEEEEKEKEGEEDTRSVHAASEMRAVALGLGGLALAEGLDRLNIAQQRLLLCAIRRTLAWAEEGGDPLARPARGGRVVRELTGLLDRVILTLPPAHREKRGGLVVGEVIRIVRTIIHGPWLREGGGEGEVLAVLLHTMDWALPPRIMSGEGERGKGEQATEVDVILLALPTLVEGMGGVWSGMRRSLLRLLLRIGVEGTDGRLRREVLGAVGAAMRLGPGEEGDDEDVIEYLLSMERHLDPGSVEEEGWGSLTTLLYALSLQHQRPWSPSLWSMAMGMLSEKLLATQKTHVSALGYIRYIKGMLAAHEREARLRPEGDVGVGRATELARLLWRYAGESLQAGGEEVQIKEWDVLLGASGALCGLTKDETARAAVMMVVLSLAIRLTERKDEELERVLGVQLLGLAAAYPQAFKGAFQSVKGGPGGKGLERAMRLAVPSSSPLHGRGSGEERRRGGGVQADVSTPSISLLSTFNMKQ